MQIYIDGPEGNAFFIIGMCLVEMQSIYPDKETCAKHATDFIERVKALRPDDDEVSIYKTLLHIVEEVSLGKITFTEGTLPIPVEPAVLDASLQEIQMFGMAAMVYTPQGGEHMLQEQRNA